MQFAVAATAVHLKHRHAKQLYMVSGGDGKSRVTAATALLLLLTDVSVQRVHVVFSNQVLLDKDRRHLTEAAAAAGFPDDVLLHASLDFEQREGDFIVFDEGDEHIFQQSQAFARATLATRCVVFTATSCEGKEGAEQEVLKHLGVKVFAREPGKVRPAPGFDPIDGISDDHDMMDYLES